MRRLVFMATLIALTMLNATAQPHGKGQMINKRQNEMKCVIPNLTEQQQTQIEKLRLEHLKKRNQHHAEMAEMQATKRKLMIADTPDQKAINALIDKISAKQAEMQKATAMHRLEIRNLLTDEQKIVFDNRQFKGKHYVNNRYQGHRDKTRMGRYPNCPMNQNQDK